MSNSLLRPKKNLVECNPCRQGAIRGHCGRPNTTVSYQYGEIYGATLGEFVDAWEASGGKTWIANFDGVGGGECHWYCPILDGADFIIDGEVQTTETAEPNPRNGEDAWDELCPPVLVPQMAIKKSDVWRWAGCWQQQFEEAGVDNSFTSWRDTGASITIEYADNCPSGTFAIPNTTGWSAQVNAISAGIAATVADSKQNSSYCAIPNTDPPIGCAGLPTPSIFLPDMKWRYAGFRLCPGDKTPIQFIYNSDQRENVVLDYNIKRSEVRFFDRFINERTGEDRWVDCATGLQIPFEELENGKPLCALPCEMVYPENPAIPPCNAGFKEGCIFDADGVKTVEGVTMLFKFCEGEDLPQLQYLTGIGTEAQEEITLNTGDYFGNCDSGEPISPDEPTKTAELAGVISRCIIQGETQAIKYSVSDFDPGDLEVGDTGVCTISLGGPTGMTAEFRDIDGITFTETGALTFEASFVYDGTTLNIPLIADVTLPDGSIGVIEGSDFYLCSGGSEGQDIVFGEPTQVKQFCFYNGPDVWQDKDCNLLNPDDLTFCPDDSDDCYLSII